jgi:hypothetical protein
MAKKAPAVVIKTIDLCGDPDAGGKWATVCLAHGEFVQFTTKANAQQWIYDTQVWCYSCQQTHN